MLRKRLRMTLDFEVTVEELTDESLREYYRGSTNYDDLVGDAELWDNLSRQIRLQKALLEDEEALRRFITYVVTDEVDPNLDSRLSSIFGVGGVRVEEEILETLFSRLGDDDARYFREENDAGYLFESIQVLSRSVVARVTRALLEEIRAEEKRVVAEGSFGDWSA